MDRLPTLDDRMDDVRAVMDAAGSESAAVFGTSEGGVMSALFTGSQFLGCTLAVRIGTPRTEREAGLPRPARDGLQRIVTGWVPLKDQRDDTCALSILHYLRSNLIHGGFQQRPSNPNRELLRFRDSEASDVAQDEQRFDSNAERQSGRQALKT